MPNVGDTVVGEIECFLRYVILKALEGIKLTTSQFMYWKVAYEAMLWWSWN